MSAGKERRGLRGLVLVKADSEFVGIGAVHNESRLEFLVKRVVCQCNDVSQLLTGVLLRLVDEGDLPACGPAKLVGADNDEQR
jgi:hypothetical protein